MAELDIEKQAAFSRWWQESGYRRTGQQAIDDAGDGVEALVSEVLVREVVAIATSCRLA